MKSTLQSKSDATRETIILQKGNGVGRIILNRPEALNAVNDRMGVELGRALQELEADENVRCLVVTGSGRAFCAGEDVSGFKARKFASLDEILRTKYHPIIQRIRGMEKPVIASLNGIAAGGGASIALACDIRIASEDASIKMAFIGMGLVPDAGSSYFLSELVGRGRAIELIMTGRTVHSKEALELGLFNKVVPATKLDSTVDEITKQLVNSPRIAIGLSKRVINRVSGNRLSDVLEIEAETQRLASETPDHREAVNAFLEKRRPRFG